MRLWVFPKHGRKKPIQRKSKLGSPIRGVPGLSKWFAASDVPGRQDETAVSLTWFELNAVSLHPSPYGGNKRNCPSEGSLAATCGRPFCNSYQADNQLGRSAGGGGFTSFGVSDFFSLRSSIRTPLVESNVLGRSLAPVQMTSVSPSSL